MKINDLLNERRVRQTVLMYHGTSDVFLDSILKNGLMANPPKRTYSGDEDDPNDSDGYITYGGVYLAERNPASDAAYAATRKFGGRPMIITVQYVIGSGNIDEDHITNHVIKGVRKASSRFYIYTDMLREVKGKNRSVDFPYDDRISNTIKSLVTKRYNHSDPNQEYDEVFEDLYWDNQEEILNSIAEEVVENLSKYGKPKTVAVPLVKKAAQYIMNTVDGDVLDSGTAMTVIGNDPDFRSIIEKLMKAFNDDPSSIKNIQVTRTIGFRGRTKIIKIETQDGIVYQAPKSHITY